MLYRTSYVYLRMVLHGYLKLCVYFFYKEHTVVVATRVFYYPPGGYFTPPPPKKIFLSCRPPCQPHLMVLMVTHKTTLSSVMLPYVLHYPPHTTYSLRQHNTPSNTCYITNLCYTIIVYAKQDVRKA